MQRLSCIVHAIASVIAIPLVIAATAYAQDAPPSDPPTTPEEAPPAPPPPPSTADLLDGEARALFEAGSLAFDAGDFERASEHFARAYELSRRPALLYNVGLAADRLRRDEEALDAFVRYLRAEPGSPNRPAVESRIDALRAGIAARAQEERAIETRAHAESTTVFERWWFWTLIGALAVGGAVTAIVLLASDPGVEQPIPGTLGTVATALRF